MNYFHDHYRIQFQKKFYYSLINFELKNGSRITGVIFTKNKNKWININIDGTSIEEIKKNNKIYVNDVNQWSYMIPSTKYSVIDTKLKDLLVEE